MKIRPSAYLIFDVLELPALASWWCCCGETWNQANLSGDRETIRIGCSKDHFKFFEIRNMEGVTDEIIKQIDADSITSGVRYSKLGYGQTPNRGRGDNFEARFLEWTKNQKDRNPQGWSENLSISVGSERRERLHSVEDRSRRN